MGLRICTNFPRFSYDFTVTVMENITEKDQKSLNLALTSPAGKPPAEPAVNFCSMRFSINNYFKETGEFNEAQFEEHVKSVLEDYENGTFYYEQPFQIQTKKNK